MNVTKSSARALSLITGLSYSSLVVKFHMQASRSSRVAISYSVSEVIFDLAFRGSLKILAM